MKLALKTYVWLEATVYNDRYGLEEEFTTVEEEDEKGKKLSGKWVDEHSESEGETDEESVDDHDDDAADNADTEVRPMEIQMNKHWIQMMRARLKKKKTSWG